AASISRSRMSLISPGRSVVSVAIRGSGKGQQSRGGRACEKYHKQGFSQAAERRDPLVAGVGAWWQGFDARSGGQRSYCVAMAGSLRDLKVWQEAVALGGEVLRVVRHSARRETKPAT